MNRRRASLLPVVVAVLFGACSPGSSYDPPTATPGAAPGGELRVGITAPGSIDPATAADPMGMLVVRTMCDSLVAFDATTGEPVPGVADSWQVSNSGSHFNLKLRRGARFADGSKVTADDVRFSLSRVARQETASAVAGLLRPVAGYSHLHGDDDGGSAEDRRFFLGVNVISDTTLEIDLERDQSDFSRVLGHTLAAIVPRDAVEADPDAFAARPVCAGPYSLAAPWTPEAREITLVAAQEYRAGSGGSTRGGAGYADRIVFRIYDSSAAAIDAYRRGEVDVVRVPGSLRSSVEDVAAGLASGADGLIEYVGLPVRTAPFDDPEVRAAFSIALDRRAIAGTVFAGARAPATGFVPPSVTDAFRRDACGPVVAPDADVERARAMVRDAGVRLEGVPMSFSFNDELGNRAIVEAVAAQWQAAFGIVPSLVPSTWDEYVSTGRGEHGFPGPFRFSMRAPYPSAAPYLDGMFHSSRIGEDNISRWIDDQFDRLVDRGARQAEEDEDRILDHQRLEDRLCAALPMLPLVFGGSTWLIRPDAVAAARPSPIAVAWGEPALRDLWLPAAAHP